MDLQSQLVTGRDAPPRLFAYPSDAWLYLALPADNPTPFCLLSGYSTPQQFDAKIRDDYEKWGPIIKAAGMKAE